jgi:regulator of ribonuclease activity A
VINGCVRDSNALASMPFGVAASATCPRKSRKEGTGAVAVPVAFGGVTFHPGQWVYVDDDGIALSEEKLVLP